MRRVLAASLLLLASAAAPGAAIAQEAGPFDLLVLNGRVLDGTGNP